MSTSSAHRDSLPEHPDQDLADYRPVSGWCVAALLVGLVSAAALAHPLLWCLPLAGVVVSLIALRQIARSEIKLLGRKAALIGLAFSLIYGVAAPARQLSREHWLAARAERLAAEFVELLRTRQTEQAFELSLQSVQKSSTPHPSMPGEPKRPDPPSPMQSFLLQAPVGKLLALGADARVEHRRTELLGVDGSRQSLGVVYEIYDPKNPSPNPTEILIYVEQLFDADGQERWWISNVALPTRSRL